jgi:hypothetical protein
MASSLRLSSRMGVKQLNRRSASGEIMAGTS